MYEYLSEEDIFTLERRFLNLQFLLRLKDEGFDIQDALYGYCGCGNCTNEPFVVSTLMLIFGSIDESEVQISNYELEEWCDIYGINPEEKELSEIEMIYDVMVQDDDALESIIPEILEYRNDPIIKLEAITKESPITEEPESWWHLIIDQWLWDEEDILGLFLELYKKAHSQEVAA